MTIGVIIRLRAETLENVFGIAARYKLYIVVFICKDISKVGINHVRKKSYR